MKLPLDYKVEFIKDVLFDDFKKAEDFLKITLPQSYKNYLINNGRFKITKKGSKYSYYEMIHPSTSIELIQKEIDEFDEEVFGTEKEDIEAAHEEFNLRIKLYPFQYYSTYVSDFWCFYIDGKKNDELYIIDIFHDDFELSSLLSDELQYCEDFNNYSFEDFIKWHFIKIESELNE